MRTSLSLSTLFAVSLLGGAALAERPHDGAAVREPRSLEQLRAHGDVVDKVYSAPSERAPQAASRSSRVSPPQAVRSPTDRASRINCAETDVDCGSSSRGVATRASGFEASASGRAASHPSFLDHVFGNDHGNDRANYGEASDAPAMSAHTANRTWSHAAAEQHAGATKLTGQPQVDRKDQQASSARMSCNEADECSMSIKAARKEWASASIKAGTWSGPAATPVSDAARRIAAQRAAESASAEQTRATRAAARAEGAGHGAGAAVHDGDHEH